MENSGQSCNAPTRMLVPFRRLEESFFIAKSVCNSLIVGNPQNEDTDVGPLAKCSFEETTEQIFKASIFGELDNLDGVSANIMMGQLIPSGTGDTKILLDEMKLLNVKKDKNVKKEEEEKEIDQYCKNNLGFDIDIEILTILIQIHRSPKIIPLDYKRRNYKYFSNI